MTKPLITQKCVIYARVSSKEQEREGYSIPAQLKFLNEYANQNGFIVAKEFVDNETAKKSGRTNFGEMIKYLRKHTTIKTILVEKTDRLYRNFKDYVNFIYYFLSGSLMLAWDRPSLKMMYKKVSETASVFTYSKIGQFLEKFNLFDKAEGISYKPHHRPRYGM